MQGGEERGRGRERETDRQTETERDTHREKVRERGGGRVRRTNALKTQLVQGQRVILCCRVKRSH